MPDTRNQIPEIEKKRSKLRHYSLQVSGVVLILVGIILSLPLVPGPGFVLIITGILLLGEESRLGGWLFSKIPVKAIEALPEKLRTTIIRRREFYFNNQAEKKNKA